MQCNKNRCCYYYYIQIFDNHIRYRLALPNEYSPLYHSPFTIKRSLDCSDRMEQERPLWSIFSQANWHPTREISKSSDIPIETHSPSSNSSAWFLNSISSSMISPSTNISNSSLVFTTLIATPVLDLEKKSPLKWVLPTIATSTRQAISVEVRNVVLLSVWHWWVALFFYSSMSQP